MKNINKIIRHIQLSNLLDNPIESKFKDLLSFFDNDLNLIKETIVWDDIFPETFKRLLWFKENIREYYSITTISNKDLEKTIYYSFGMYGQGEVYSIYYTVLNKLEDGESLKDAFEEFVEAFRVLKPEVVNALKPKTYIELFIEYIYSLHIKR